MRLGNSFFLNYFSHNTTNDYSGIQYKHGLNIFIYIYIHTYQQKIRQQMAIRFFAKNRRVLKFALGHLKSIWWALNSATEKNMFCYTLALLTLDICRFWHSNDRTANLTETGTPGSTICRQRVAGYSDTCETRLRRQTCSTSKETAHARARARGAVTTKCDPRDLCDRAIRSRPTR